jgi:hypothetical protein
MAGDTHCMHTTSRTCSGECQPVVVLRAACVLLVLAHCTSWCRHVYRIEFDMLARNRNCLDLASFNTMFRVL